MLNKKEIKTFSNKWKYKNNPHKNNKKNKIMSLKKRKTRRTNKKKGLITNKKVRRKKSILKEKIFPAPINST